MPTRILDPGHRRRIRHTVPRGGKVDIYVDASHPVNIYILDTVALGAFRLGNDVREYGGFRFTNREEFDRAAFRLPFVEGDDWYLMIENDSAEPVAIHYEVDY